VVRRNRVVWIRWNETPTRSPAAGAVVGFLARYPSKNTVSAFALDLRLLFQWCAAQGLDPLDATRTHLELFARYLEDERGNGPASVHRRLSTITCFYRMAEIDNYLDRSPATHLRLPHVYRDETTTLGLDRTELGAILAAARASTPSDAALITMLGPERRATNRGGRRAGHRQPRSTRRHTDGDRQVRQDPDAPTAPDSP
jgi:integrase/recombinase XerD